jgi:hypothetical protein
VNYDPAAASANQPAGACITPGAPNFGGNVAPGLDLNGGAGGLDFSTSFSNTGAIAITDTANATVGDDSGNIVSLTATLSAARRRWQSIGLVCAVARASGRDPLRLDIFTIPAVPVSGELFDLGWFLFG